MIRKLVLYETLHEEDFTAIGKCAASFSTLEHHLVNALIALHGGPDQISAKSKTERDIHSAINGTLGIRLKAFAKAYRSKYPLDSEINKFEKKLSEGLNCRNHFLHGIWRKSGNQLVCEFWKRSNEGPVFLEVRISREDIIEIHESNKRNIIALDEFIKEEESKF